MKNKFLIKILSLILAVITVAGALPLTVLAGNAQNASTPSSSGATAIGTLEEDGETESGSVNNFVVPTAQDIRNALGNSALMYYNSYDSSTAYNNGQKTDLNSLGVEERYGQHAVVSDPTRTGKVLQINSAAFTSNGINYDGFQFNIYTSVGNAHSDASTAGKSFVLSMDIKLGDFVSEGTLATMRCALYGRQDVAANGGSLVLLDKNPIYLNKQGALCYGGSSASSNAFCYLSSTEYTNVAIHVNVKENYYDIYVNGEMCVEKQLFLTSDDIAKIKATNSTTGEYLYPAFAENGFGISQFYTSHQNNADTGISGTHFYIDNLTFYLGNEYVKANKSIYTTDLFEYKSELTENKLANAGLTTESVLNHIDFEDFEIGYTRYTPVTNDSTNGIIENLMANSALAGAGVALNSRMKDNSPNGGIRIVDDGHGGKAAQLTGLDGERFFQISSVGEPATANSGKSFVISGNFKKSGSVSAGLFFPITARYAFVTGHQDINALVLFIDESGKIYYSQKDGAVLVNVWDTTQQKNASYGNADHCIAQLTADKFTNIAISVNVAENTFKVYVDGIDATGDLTFMPDSYQQLWSTSDAYPNGFGYAYSRLGVQNLIFDDLLVVYGTSPVIGNEIFVKENGVLYLKNSNGTPIANRTYPDGMLKTNSSGAFTFNGTKVSLLDDIYTVLDGEVILKNGYVSGLYTGNTLLGESGSTYCYDKNKNLVVDCPAFTVDGTTYTVDARGVCTVANGVVILPNGARYYKNGVLIDSPGYVEGDTNYYVKEDGYLANGLVEIDGKYYFFKNYRKNTTITSSVKIINEITGNRANNLSTAINSASSGDTLTLLADVTVNSDLVMPDDKKITINVNGHNLTANSFTAFGLTDIIDTEISDKGALITNKDSLSLSESLCSDYLPVKNTVANSAKSSYSFYKLTNRYKLTENGDNFELLFRPTLENSATVNSNVFGSGNENSGISISVDLTVYKSGSAPYTKSFYFNDETVKAVYSSNSKAFKAVVTCKEKFDAIKVRYTVHSPIRSISMDEQTIYPTYASDRIYIENKGYDSALFADFDKDGVYDGNGYSGTTTYTTVWIDVPNVDLMEYRDYHTFNFKVYSSEVSNAFIEVRPHSCTETQFFTAIQIFLNFTGWKEFSMKIDALTTQYPLPTLDKISITQESGDAGATFTISDIEVRREKLEVVVEDGVDVTNDSVYESVFTNFYNYTFGTSYSKELPVYQNKISSTNTSCASAWESFKNTYDSAVVNRNGLFGIDLYLPTNGRGGHFTSSDYQLTDEMVNIYSKIASMAAGWAFEDSDYYHNEELLSDIKKALEYGYNNYYGSYILENGTGTTNWWGWRLGTPMQLVPTLVYIREELTEAEIKKYLAPFDMLLPFPIGSASNLINMAYARVLASALEKDYEGMAIAMYSLEGIYPYVTSDQMWKGTDGGFFEDGSFIQHNNIPYHGSYGMSFISTLPVITHLTNATAFQTSDENIHRQFEWAMDSFDHVVYGTNLMATTMGRSVGVSEYGEYQNFLRGIIAMLPYVPADIKDEFYSFVKEHMLRRGSSFSLIVSPLVSPYAEVLWNDESVLPRELVGYTKVFGSMARVVQHGPKYGVCIALSSTKISKYESINGANEAGWYHGDGMIYLYTYNTDYDYVFFNYANPYLMPGTTVNSAIRKRITNTAQNSSDFAGGAAQGLLGVSGFMLEYDWIRSQATFSKPSDASIKAKKSYFLFDDEVVCIGSGISDSSGTAVKTVVENRVWQEGQKLYIDGCEINISGKSFEYYTSGNNNLVNDLTYVAPGARSMHFTGMGGYIFLGDNTVRYDKTTYNASATQGTLAEDTRKDASEKHSFLEITIDHGKNPSGGKYSYVYLPEATLAKTNAYAENPDVKILSDSDTVHAVLETDIGALGAVFYSAGTLNVSDTESPVTRIYSKNSACVIVSTNENGETVISVSDPTNSLTSLFFQFSIAKGKSIKTFDDGISGATITNTGVLSFTVNTTDACGKTFSITVA